MKNKTIKKYLIGYSEDDHHNRDDYISSFVELEIDKGEIPESQAHELKIVSRRVISNFLSKDNVVLNRRVGLLVGQVQSGKTKTFLGVIAAAFDAEYDAVVVLSGNDTVLKNQTLLRLNDTFRNKHFEEKEIRIEQINTESQISIIKNELTSELSNEINAKYIFPTLKNVSWLKKIVNTLKGIDKKLLIIDDEGDQASLNVENSKKDLDSLEEASAINRNIRQIIENSTAVSYLTVTATPYANLVLNEGRELSPEFCEVLTPGPEYKGLEFFHSGSDEFIREIDPLAMKRDKSNESVNYMFNDIVSRALPAFVVGNAYIRRTQPEKKNKKFQMLIHVEKKVIANAELKTKIEHYKSEILEFANKAEDSIEYQKYFIEDFVMAGIIQNNFVVDKSDDLFREIVRDVKLYLPPLTIDHKYSKNKVENDDNLGDTVIIGSDLVERGVTFKRLRTTFMGFVPKTKMQGDTIVQRARWFGYRKTNDYHLVYLPSKLIDVYEQLNTAQIELYEQISFKEGLQNVIQNGFPFPFEPTRKTVNILAKFGSIDRELYRQNKNSPISNFNEEKDLIYGLVSNFERKEYFDWGHMYYEVGHSILDNSEILKFINSKLSDGSHKFDLAQYVKNNGIKNIHIMFPRVDKKDLKKDELLTERKRRIYDDERVDIFQGRSDESKTLFDNFRPNDRDVLKNYCNLLEIEEPVAQIQVHNIKPIKDGEFLKNEIFYSVIVNGMKVKTGVIK